MGLMKEALKAEGLKPHLMAQPLGYRTPDGGHFGWIDIPEFPFGKNIYFLFINVVKVIFVNNLLSLTYSSHTSLIKEKYRARRLIESFWASLKVITITD
jgi:hypothetical protein